MRGSYYALNERPLCGKCRVPYAKKIANSEGPGSMLRAAIQGGVVAVAGAVVLGLIVTVFPAAKIFVLVPIGYLIGKRIMVTLDSYSARRYQYLAVGLTYLSFLAGIGVPTYRVDAADAERRAEVRTKMQGTAATQSDAIAEELESQRVADSIEAAADGETDSSAVADSADAEPGPVAPPAQSGSPRIGLMILLVLFLPLLSMLGFGMAFSAVGVLSLGYAFVQAWKQTDGQGLDLQLSGPFKVGEGPIAAR